MTMFNPYDRFSSLIQDLEMYAEAMDNAYVRLKAQELEAVFTFIVEQDDRR